MKPCRMMLAALLAALALTQAAGAAQRPNFVVIFADDIGYGDLGVYGNPVIRTPNLDRMAAEGMKLTQFYAAAPACTPSRAALLTGRYPPRTTLPTVIDGVAKNGLPPAEVTIAELLKPAGYATMCIGKWHLGHRPQFLPTTQGFDHYLGIPYSHDMDRAVMGEPPIPLMRDGKVIEQPADISTLTPRYTEEAVKFIREHKAGPFFLYMPHSYPHVPLDSSPAFKDKSIRGAYGDTVEELDWSVGEVLRTLREEGLAENTFVLFTSDNGPWLVKGLDAGSAGPMREGKGTTWEGGMREPAIAWWPGRVAAGSTNETVTSTLDLLPTICALAGVEAPGDRIIDGRDISAVLRGEAGPADGTMFYYQGMRLHAVRMGPWKAHFISQAKQASPPVEHDPPLLFNLDIDPGEQFDVAAEHPDVIAKLKALAAEHKQSRNAEKLHPGWEYSD